MDVINLYCEYIIKPIEEEVKKLRAKVYSKNFFDWLNRSLYKEYLEKTENLLFESYRKLEIIIEDELQFQKEDAYSSFIK